MQRPPGVHVKLSADDSLMGVKETDDGVAITGETCGMELLVDFLADGVGCTSAAGGKHVGGASGGGGGAVYPPGVYAGGTP